MAVIIQVGITKFFAITVFVVTISDGFGCTQVVRSVIIIAIIAIAITFTGLCVGIAFALIWGIEVYLNGQRTLSNVILVVSVFGIIGTVALIVAEGVLL